MEDNHRVERVVNLLLKQADRRAYTNEIIEKQLAADSANGELYPGVQDTFADDFTQLLVRRQEGLTSHTEDLYIDKLIEEYRLCRELWSDVLMTFAEDFPKRLLLDGESDIAPKKRSILRIIRQLPRFYKRLFLACMLLLVLVAAVVRYFGPQAGNLSLLSAPALSRSVTLELGDGQLFNLSADSCLSFTAGGIKVSSLGDTLVLSSSTAGSYKGWCKLNVPVGRTIRAKLPDGSLVHLAPQSSLRLRSSFNEQQREVYMDGEAFFSVAASTEHSFVIQVPDVKIQALSGSIVHVQNYGRNLEASIIEGVATMYGNDEYVYVMPGRTLLFDRETEQLQTRKAKTNWLSLRKEGTYIMAGKPLAEVCELVERLYGVKIVIDDRLHSYHSYTTVVSGKRLLSDFLNDLCTQNKLRYYIDEDRQIHIDDIP